MKFKTKKIAYFLNDLTNILLKKDREEKEEDLRRVIVWLSILLGVSVVINILQFFNIL